MNPTQQPMQRQPVPSQMHFPPPGMNPSLAHYQMGTPHQQQRPGVPIGNPPNAPSPLGPNQHQAPQYGHMGVGRPGSRAGGPETPRSATMPQPSPSMANRMPPQGMPPQGMPPQYQQPPTPTPQQQQQQQPQQPQQPQQQQRQPPPMDDSMRQLQAQHMILNQDIDNAMAQLRSMSPGNRKSYMEQAGLAGKDFENLQYPEKVLTLHRPT